MSGEQARRPEPRPRAPVCSTCRGGMDLVTAIARTTQNPAVEIYRCAGCDHVAWIEEPPRERG